MAQYEFSRTPLTEAGDAFFALSGDLYTAIERLEGVFHDLPEVLRDFRRQINAECGVLEDLCGDARKLGETLRGVVEIYTRAERSALDGSDHGAEQRAAARMPAVQETRGVLLFGDLLLPDWLQAAVIQYEQSRGD